MNLDSARGLIVSGELLSEERFNEFQRQWLERGRTADDGDEFVRWLVEQRELTDFQADAVRAGIAGPYLLGPYRVTARITAGRLGDVYHAEHVEFQQPVSLKVFPPTLNQDSERLARLGREARVSLQVDHPHVIRTYQVGKAGTVPFIALEALNGETLQRRLKRDGRLTVVQACQLIQQAALGLAYLHSQEIIHRDICPANLWVTDQGVLKVMEFGAARDAMSFVDSIDEQDGEELTINSASGGLLGTYDYMSAEQAEDTHSAGVGCDLYSLGCTFYHCLTGQVPFPDKNPIRQMLRHSKEQPRPLSDFVPEIPQLVQDVMTHLLAKDPDERYDSGENVASDLEEIIPLAALPPTPPAAPEFLGWLQSVDGESIVAAEETPPDPEMQTFFTFLSEYRDEDEEE
jgi:serine/threonine-protein kinase